MLGIRTRPFPRCYAPGASAVRWPTHTGGDHPWVRWLRFIDDPVSIAYARRVYDAWWGGLVTLADVFGANRDRLYSYTVTGPRAPHHPWKARKTGACENGVDNLVGNH